MEDLTETLIICALLLIATIAIPFWLPRKLRIIKYLCWVIAGFLALFLFVMVQYNGYWTDREAKYRVGIYQMDIVNSNYHHLDLTKFKSLTLNLKGDYTFTFNQDVPFLVSNSGTWLYWIDGDAPILKLKFKNAKNAYPLSGVDPILELDSDILWDGKSGDKIVFKQK